MSSSNPGASSTVPGELASLFRKAGWSVRRPAAGPDLVIRRGDDITYVVELKQSSEGRADRLVPLMAQAILQAQTYANKIGDVAPLAVVGAPYVPARVVTQLRDFAAAHAPEVAVGIVDSRGLRDFSGTGLESLNARAMAQPPRGSILDRKTVDLFSDLNQWLIKTILAPYLNDPALLAAPLHRYSKASELAIAAGVSVMTASRFVRQLRAEGFLDEGSSEIHLVRFDDLFRRWQAAAIRPTVEIGARWLLPGDRRVQIERALRSPGQDACLGLFAAADALRVGVVRGVATHLYVRELSAAAIERMKMTTALDSAGTEILVRVPSAPESVFRGAVNTHGIRSSDIFQVWLDVQNQPSRGKEQAEVIYRRVIAPMLKRAKHGV
jgi:Holliday junction resolvase